MRCSVVFKAVLMMGRLLVFTGNSQLCSVAWGVCFLGDHQRYEVKDAPELKHSLQVMGRSRSYSLVYCTRRCLQISIFSNNQSLLRNILWLSPSTYSQLSSESNNLWIFPRTSPVSQEASNFLIHHHVMDHFPGEMDMKTYLIILPSLI